MGSAAGVSTETQGLRTKSSVIRRQEKMDVLAQENLPFLHLSVLLGPLTDWLMPTCMGEGGYSLLSLLIQLLMSFGNALTDTFRNNVSPAIWSSLSPVKLKHEINHHIQ